MAVRFGGFRLDVARRQIFRGTEELHLQPRAFRFLEILIAQQPRAVRKKELMNLIWGEVVVEESNLSTIASEVRSILGDASLIRTVQRYGYAFAGAVVDDSSPQRTYRLHGDTLHVSVSLAEAVIGRDTSCEVWVDSPDVSRRHARITMTPERIAIEDLDSKNGTWVGDSRIEGLTELFDGDTIRVGDVTLMFRAAGPADSTVSAE